MISYLFRIWKSYNRLRLQMIPSYEFMKRINKSYGRLDWFLVYVMAGVEAFRWFFRSIPVLEGKRPAVLILRGKLKIVEDMVCGFESSLWS